VLDWSIRESCAEVEVRGPAKAESNLEPKHEVTLNKYR